MVKAYRIIFAASIIILLISLGAFVIVFQSLRSERMVVPVSFIVDSDIGFDLNSSSLSFGRVLPGSGATRQLILNNSGNESMTLEARVSKNIKDYIIADFPETIEPRNTIKVPVTVNVPSNMSHGNYSGFIVIKTKKAG